MKDEKLKIMVDKITQRLQDNLTEQTTAIRIPGSARPKSPMDEVCANAHTPMEIWFCSINSFYEVLIRNTI